MNQNTERQYNLDLMKALAIVCMVVCHAVITFGGNREGHINDFWYLFGDCVIGGYLVVAHGFMFAMGVGMVYSRKNSPEELIHRGVNLLLLGYVLSFFRKGIYYLTECILTGVFTEEAMLALFRGDILHFAGLAFIATGILKKLKLKEMELLFIGLVLSMIGAVASGLATQNFNLNMVIGLFVFTASGGTSTFAFCNWYIFVAAGIVFGKILQGTEDKDSLYKILLVVSGIISAIYIAATRRFGWFFLCKNHDYYDASPMEAFGLLAIDFFVLSIFYFLLKKVDVSNFKLAIEMSVNINIIYCIHWWIVNTTDFFLCHLLHLEIMKNYGVMYAFGIVLVVVAFLLARYYKTWKQSHMIAI